MNLLVTAGNTLSLIDRVRCLTNIFTGRTGAEIALEARRRGHAVTLLTSHPEVVVRSSTELDLTAPGWALLRYQTFDELEGLMASRVSRPDLDAVIHTAAVSDYLSAGVFAPGEKTHFDPEQCCWVEVAGGSPALVDRSAGKVKSDEPELWLRLVRAPKLIDRVRTAWKFQGTLVKFKLEVGVDDAALLEVAERSRQHSHADIMVANTLEGSATHAYLGPIDGHYQRVHRRELSRRLLEAVEHHHEARSV